MKQLNISSQKLVKFFLISCSVSALLLGSSLVSAKIFKWVDESGETHFGDVVPPKYAQSASEVEILDERITDNPDPQADLLEAERAMQKSIRQSEKDKQQRQERLRYEREARQNQQRQQSQPSFGYPTTRAGCRDTFPSKADTAARVACFKSVE